jgi:hypothetical protein
MTVFFCFLLNYLRETVQSTVEVKLNPTVFAQEGTLVLEIVIVVAQVIITVLTNDNGSCPPVS